MKEAAESGAHLIHFPETSLPGYGRSDFARSSADNWRELEDHTGEIANLSGKLGLWTVLGSCRKVADEEKPANCVHVISDKGRVVGTYDKRQLTPSEFGWYSPGNKLLEITVNGVKCGFLICYESCFPDLFEEYRKSGVRLIFHACHNVSRKRQRLFNELTLAQIRTRAIDNQMWIATSNSAARYSFSKTCVARPDGSIRSLRKHSGGILLHDFPDMKLGWTYDNRAKRIDVQDEEAFLCTRAC